MNLKKKDIFMIIDHAKGQMRQMPGRVLIDGKELDQTDRVALAYFYAVCQVLGEHGIDTTDIQVQYDEEISYTSLSEFESQSHLPEAKPKKKKR